jgi:hypothetical protein
MEEGTMGKVIAMRVHILSQEDNNQEIKEEVDPVDRASNSQSVETTKEKGLREIVSWKKFKGFCRYCGMQDARVQSIRLRCEKTKYEHGKWKQRREPEQ